jgi:psiF repeat
MGNGGTALTVPAIRLFIQGIAMNRWVSTAVLLGASLLGAGAQASTHKEAPMMAASGASAPMGKQQSRMASCNTEAKAMKGDERKAFMKTCLSGEMPKQTQQSKMKSCNANAKDMKGDARKAFMKECLSA